MRVHLRDPLFVSSVRESRNRLFLSFFFAATINYTGVIRHPRNRMRVANSPFLSLSFSRQRGSFKNLVPVAGDGNRAIGAIAVIANVLN